MRGPPKERRGEAGHSAPSRPRKEVLSCKLRQKAQVSFLDAQLPQGLLCLGAFGNSSIMIRDPPTPKQRLGLVFSRA